MTVSKRTWVIGIGILVLLVGFLSRKIYATNLAHTTFERYYAFRGCAHLIDRTDTYGNCTLANGQQIKIVLYKNRWYLDGDLPSPYGDFTF